MGQLLDALRRIESSSPTQIQAAAAEFSPPLRERAGERGSQDPARSPVASETPSDQSSPLQTSKVFQTSEVSIDACPHPDPLPKGEGTACEPFPKGKGTSRARRPARRVKSQVRPTRNREPGSAEVLSHLLREFPPGRRAVLLFTSPEPDEAATAAVAELARALAPRVTGHVLAVEGNPGRAGLARRLAATGKKGDASAPRLAEVLAGTVPWRQAVRGTRTDRLDVLAGRADDADGPPATPTARWTRTLREFRQEYQFVLIGVTPADNPTVCGIAPWADAAYLIIRPGRTGRSAARWAVQILRQDGARLLGCVVLNDIS